jgi:hypothetical protein
VYYLHFPNTTMSTFLAAALALPTVVFTVLLGFFILYSILTLLGAADFEWLDGVLGVHHHVHDSVLEVGLHAFGVVGIPLTIFGGVSSIFAWMASFAAMRFLPDGALVKLAVGIGAALLGLFIGSRAVRPFRSFFITAAGPTRKQLVGKICTIRSLRVGDDRGTAEIGDLVAEVRCFRDNELTVGSKAIVYDYDSQQGLYHVGPVDPSIAN